MDNAHCERTESDNNWDDQREEKPVELHIPGSLGIPTHDLETVLVPVVISSTAGFALDRSTTVHALVDDEFGTLVDAVTQ